MAKKDFESYAYHYGDTEGKLAKINKKFIVHTQNYPVQELYAFYTKCHIV